MAWAPSLRHRGDNSGAGRRRGPDRAGVLTGWQQSLGVTSSGGEDFGLAESKKKKKIIIKIV